MILYKYNFYKKDGINVSLFEKFIDMIENDNDSQSFKLTTPTKQDNYTAPTSQTVQNKVKGKNPQLFDYAKERELLAEYNKHKNDSDKSNVYFTAMPLIDFYYKFRNLDKKYLDLCIQYCNICIDCLNCAYMKKEIKEGINIPAYKRLSIIYTKNKEYEKALKIIDQALKHNQDKEHYKKQRESIMKKIS